MVIQFPNDATSVEAGVAFLRAKGMKVQEVNDDAAN